MVSSPTRPPDCERSTGWPREAHASEADTRLLFAAFTLLLAIGTLYHQALATDWQLLSLNTPLSLAALYAALRPRSISAFWLLVGCHLADLFVDLPFITNHVVVQGFVELAALMSLAVVALSREQRTGDPAALYRVLAPMVRVLVILMYGFAALAKMNSDFMDPQLSSAVALLGSVRSMLVFIPDGEWTAAPVILGTIVLEAALPLLLFLRSTRLATVLVALLFHVLMGLSGHTSFSGLAPALLFPFVPDDMPARLRRLRVEWPQLGALSDRARSWAGSVWAFPLLAALWLLVATLHTAGILTDAALSFALYSPVGVKMLLYPYLAALAAVLALCTRQGGPYLYRARPFSLSHPVCALIPLLMIFNGLCPYLGLKTQSSLTMFSNLQTEGDQWNHVFLPPAMRTFGYQDDLVEIIDSTDPMLAEHAKRRKRWVFFEFHRYLSQHPTTSVTFEHTDELHRGRQVGDHPVLSQPPRLALRKALWFRTVPPPDANGHRH